VEYQPDVKRITGEGGIIASVAAHSLGEAIGLQPGDVVVAIDGQRLRDVIDYRFAIAEERVTLLIRTAAGDEREITLTKDPDDDLGIEFTEPLFDRLRTCNNKCPFCFLTQMPKGFRKTLYLKDDDYRLSFLYANFVTFTNITEADWERIERQRLSPLYISVHATDPFWRAIMLGKRDVPDVREQIRRLGQIGIRVHTQIVACPQVNDGAVLRQSIEDLIALYPIVESIAVVPVGLTKFRFEGKAPKTIRAAIQVHETPEWIDTNWERQPLWEDPTTGSHPLHQPELGFCSRLGAVTDIPLRCYTPAEAADVIDLIEPYQRRCYEQFGTHLVYASDEFYLLAGRPIPPAETYDDMPQYSNGVGMVRDFLDNWARARRRLPARIAHPTKLALVCGTLIAPVMEHIANRLNQIEQLTVKVVAVTNQFFGETVTVSGLLTAQDVIPALRASGCERALLPRVMFDYSGERSIDDYSPQQIGALACMPVALAGEATELARYIQALARSDG
jgi:NifB/MoaA-like Fe-S oxidoreductase